MKKLGAIFLVLVAGLGVSGCGEDESDAPTEAEAIQLTIETADYIEVKGDLATVTGTVEPAEAIVEIDGVTADVTGGRWTARVRLEDIGDNPIQATASYEDLPAAEASTVIVRKRTGAELADLKDQKAKARARAQERRQAAMERRARERREAAERAAAEAAAQQTTVPNLVGERLDVAKDTLRSAGLRSRVLGGGAFGVVVESNWIVCETRPGAGAPAEKGSTRVTLVIDRAC